MNKTPSTPDELRQRADLVEPEHPELAARLRASAERRESAPIACGTIADDGTLTYTWNVDRDGADLAFLARVSQ